MRMNIDKSGADDPFARIYLLSSRLRNLANSHDATIFYPNISRKCRRASPINNLAAINPKIQNHSKILPNILSTKLQRCREHSWPRAEVSPAQSPSNQVTQSPTSAFLCY